METQETDDDHIDCTVHGPYGMPHYDFWAEDWWGACLVVNTYLIL